MDELVTALSGSLGQVRAALVCTFLLFEFVFFVRAHVTSVYFRYAARVSRHIVPYVVFAQVTGTFCIFPLDVVKTRMQAAPPPRALTFGPVNNM